MDGRYSNVAMISSNYHPSVRALLQDCTSTGITVCIDRLDLTSAPFLQVKDLCERLAEVRTIVEMLGIN